MRFSTVVASASVGSVFHKEQNIHSLFRRELIAVGVAAGVAALFGSPLGGLLFAFEVILKKVERLSLLLVSFSVLIVWGMQQILHVHSPFEVKVGDWNPEVLPYFVLLGIFAAFNAVYLTRCVLFFKGLFSKIRSHLFKVGAASVLLSIAILSFPALYGDGYHSLRELFISPESLAFSYPLLLSLFAILLMKPVLTSLTLAAGGDGGVFAPSLFIGVFTGLISALLLKHFLDVRLIPLNFMLVGMAAVLSAALHAPLTAVFLVCSLAGNYNLVFPLLAASFVSRYTASFLLPYTVYSYTPLAAQKPTL